MNKYDKKTFDMVRKLYKNDYGEPFELTPGQIKIFRAIYERQHPRLQVETYTQYGKSETVAMAVLTRGATFSEKWAILGGTLKKARIIMNYVIKHLFENPYTKNKFKIGKEESLERIKRERSKQRITLKVGDDQYGEIFILSAEAKKRGEDAGDTLIGFGSPNIVEDDPGLIPDLTHSKVMRMLGGHKDNFLVKIGNSLNRNHFLKSNLNPKFKKIIIDCYQGIKEGRVTQEYIDEMKGIMPSLLFGSLYECKFPPEGAMEKGDWLPLLSSTDIEEAEKRKVVAVGAKRLGGDLAEGGDYNAFVIRQDNIARIKHKDQETDLMKTAENISKIRKEEMITDTEIFLDAIGVGAGVVSRCRQLNIKVNAIKVGSKPTERSDIEKKLDPIEFADLRAELYWKVRRWLKEGGALVPHEDWKQLTDVRYKEDNDKRIKIMSKQEMRLRGRGAMDVIDALSLTFAPKEEVEIYHKEATPLAEPYYPDIGF